MEDNNSKTDTDEPHSNFTAADMTFLVEVQKMNKTNNDNNKNFAFRLLFLLDFIFKPFTLYIFHPLILLSSVSINRLDKNKESHNI